MLNQTFFLRALKNRENNAQLILLNLANHLLFNQLKHYKQLVNETLSLLQKKKESYQQLVEKKQKTLSTKLHDSMTKKMKQLSQEIEQLGTLLQTEKPEQQIAHYEEQLALNHQKISAMLNIPV